MKRAQRLLLAFGAFALLLVALLVLALHSETVFRETVRLARPLIPGELRYAELHGTLAGPVEIDAPEYAIAGTRIRAQRIAFDFSPLDLLTGDINLGEVKATALDIALPPADETTAATPEPEPDPRELLRSLRLPVHLIAERLTVNGARLSDAGGNTLLALDRLTLTLDWNAERLAVTHLDAVGTDVSLSGGVVLGLTEDHGSSLDLDGRWRGARTPLAGRLHGDGNTQTLNLALTLSEPADIRLQAQARDLLDAPAWQGELAFDALRPAAFDPALPATAWSGALRFDGDWQDMQVNGSVHGGWPPAEGIGADFVARVNAQRIAVETLDADIASFDTSLSLRGELHYADALRYSATGNFMHFAWPELEAFALHDGQFSVNGDAETAAIELDATTGNVQPGALHVTGSVAFAALRFDADIDSAPLAFAIDDTRIELAELTARASGTPDDYRLHVDTRGRFNDLPAVAVRGNAEGDREHLVATLETVRWLDGIADGAVNVDWRDGVRLDAQLHGAGFALARLDAALSGTLGGRFDATAIFGDEKPDIAVRIESLDGDLNGAPLAGAGQLRFANDRLSTTGLNVAAGETTLALTDSAQGFDFHLRAPALERLHPELAGALAADGHFNGEFATPDLQLTVNGDELRWRDAAVETLALTTDIRDGARATSHLQLAADGLEHPALAAARLDLDLRGDRAAHRLELTLAAAAAGRLHLAAGGGWENARWQGRLLSLQAEHPAAGLWQLEDGAPQTLSIGAGHLNIPAHCLRGPSGRACLGPVRRDASGWRARAELRGLPMGLFANFAFGNLSAGLDYRGELNGGIDLQGGAGGIDGEAMLALNTGGIFQGGGAEQVSLLAWDAGEARVTFRDRRMAGDLAVVLAGGGRISGTSRIELPADAPARIDAHVRAHTDNLALLPTLIPELSRLHGAIRADLRVSGSLDAPRLRGEARLEDGSARILALGTDWENVNLTLTGTGDGIRLTGHAESGGGHIDIELDGRDTGTGFSGTARLAGENFRAVNTPEAEIDIAPALQLRLEENALRIDGEVFVPYARITPRDLSTAAQPSSDQVIVNAEQQADPRELRMHANITTRLGDDVRVDAFGLKARVTGALTVTQQPDSPAIGNGRLVIAEGEYRAYGQDLTLERGAMIYTGQPLSNPGLDIRAVRRPTPDVVVGVTVRGPLAQPSVLVFSEPAMPETEALSFLLFGRALDEATGAQASQASSTALALGLGGQKLLGRVGEKLGVEEIRVEQIGDREQAALVLGKYLSPNLYVSYGIGLYDAVNTFRIRYRISSKWTLEATSGLKSSADFIYTIER